jgi:outer membrane receptor for ferrienterochelin and colicin
MRTLRTWLTIATLFAVPTCVAAQTTNGTISGHVVDTQGLSLPGVTVNAASPNLQGIRSVTTSENGDYIFTLLPPGVYTVSFELSGFEPVRRSVTLAPTQSVPLDATLGPAAITEAVIVVGRTADVLTQTAQVATNFKQELLSTLPTTRDINAALLLSPSVHPTGPGGGISIGGAPSFESLFLVNGVTVNENLRGQPNALYIEDAIEETSVATAGISAEYGRFSGGIVNVITKSGGNLFSGSFRDTLFNDNWRALTPFRGDSKTSMTVPTYEYTIGGPVAKDRLWFFTAGRLQNQESTRQTVVTNIPYTLGDDQKRYEAKLTFSANPNHRVEGAYTKTLRDQTNGSHVNVMDLASLYTASNPQDLVTLNYNGVLSSNFFIEGRYSKRHWTSQGVGASSTDLIDGTLILDRVQNTRYWSATFCGVCDPETRDNDDAFVKGTYFLSKKGGGSHTMVFGFDGFNDTRFANNYQSGSSYRILGTTSIVRGTTVYPEFLANGSTLIQYSPITTATLGTNFRTFSGFYSDSWRASDAFTFNLGLRWDKNHGENGAGQLVAKDSALSPRLGLVWDPKRDGRWTVTASFAKYVAALSSSVADASSPGGNSTALLWPYLGPSINANPGASTLVTTPAAIQQVFDWFNANGGAAMPPVLSQVPGLSVQIPNSLQSPNVLEYAGGVGRRIRERATVRADFVYRDWRDFYSLRIDQSTGHATDQFGNVFDVGVMENTNDLTRRYAAFTLSSSYRVGSRTDIGGNYTLSRLWGNFDGESINAGPTATDLFQYPEYRQASWYAPVGDLSADQRHRASLWVNYGVPRVNGLTLSALEEMASGVPYGALGQVNAIPYVPNPGYVTPQGNTSEGYYFTARDAFHTDAAIRTDFAASYTYGLRAGARHLDLFIQAHVLNLFNELPLCGCGAAVFSSGGPVTLPFIGQSVLSNVTTPALARFNPFTTTPVEGTNWSTGSNFGAPLSRFAYQSPRTFRLSFGVRF